MVYMMYMFVCLKVSPKCFFNDMSVFEILTVFKRFRMLWQKKF